VLRWPEGTEALAREEPLPNGSVDSSGRFALSGLARGEYAREVTSHREELAPARLRVVAPASGVRIVLPPAGRVVVTAKGPAGEGVEAEFSLRAPSGEWMSREGSLASAGVFRKLLPGRYELQVTAPGLKAAVREVVVEAGKTTRLEVRLEAGRKVHGLVVDDEGEPIDDARVVLGCVDGSTRAEERTDELGHFRVAGFVDCEAEIEARHEGFATLRRPAPLEAGELKLVLPRLRLLSLRAEAPGERRPSKCTTLLWTQQADRPLRILFGPDERPEALLGKLMGLAAAQAARTLALAFRQAEFGEDGTMRLPNLEPVPHALETWCAEGTAAVEFAPPASVPTELRLEPAASLHVRIAGAREPWSVVFSCGGLVSAAQTDDQGAVLFEAVPSGSCAVGAFLRDAFVAQGVRLEKARRTEVVLRTGER